jgi:uncharacterized pyridoxal phosphate-containing UPF0001 family protein
MHESEALSILQQAHLYPHICFCGLMGIAEFTTDMDKIRVQFQRLKRFQLSITTQFPEIAPDFETLSMGMSGDYEIAIEEGATHVRIGTAIFGAR